MHHSKKLYITRMVRDVQCFFMMHFMFIPQKTVCNGVVLLFGTFSESVFILVDIVWQPVSIVILNRLVFKQQLHPVHRFHFCWSLAYYTFIP